MFMEVTVQTAYCDQRYCYNLPNVKILTNPEIAVCALLLSIVVFNSGKLHGPFKSRQNLDV
jgi:hypothetical protein